jgi:mycothiol synthase
MTTADLPPGFAMRAPTTDDLDELAALLIAYERARTGKASWQASAAREWIASVWATVGFEVARDARVIVAPTGEVAGYITVWRTEETSGHVVASPRTLPSFDALGLDVALLHWAESLARQKAAALPSAVAATLNTWVAGPDAATEAMLTCEGFHLQQRYLLMRLLMRTPPPAPEWPAGVVARPFVSGQDERAVYDVMQTAFAGAYDYDISYEEWRHEVFAPERMDPALWTLATDGETLVGAIISRTDTDDDGQMGWLEDVGVHPAWRQRGLGLAMLYHSFGGFFARGVTRCGLSVDAHNASGAVRLYERAGMAPSGRQEVRYEKALR